MYCWICALALVIGAQTVEASHISGGDLSYEYINSCTVRVHVAIYRHCSGSMVMTNTINWRPAGQTCAAPPAIVPWPMLQTAELVPVCPTAQTDCSQPGSTIIGLEENYFYRDFDVCAVAPCSYDIVWQDCCRNGGVTALTNPGSQSNYFSIPINTAMGPFNNSPRFFDKTFVYIAAGQSSQLAMGAYDPDGDSLSFALGACLTDSATSVVYANGYSPTTPLGASWAVTIDSHTGQIHFDPTPGNNVGGLICVYVNEYRNGMLIGQVERDLVVYSISTPTNLMPSLSGPTNVSMGATLLGNEIFLCNPAPICFDLLTADANGGQNLTLTWTNHFAGATFTQVGNSNVQNTILGTSNNPPAGRFCWTPTANGHYYFKFRVQDNNCSIIGFSERVVAIHVGAGPVSASATLGTCPTVNFSTLGCGNGPFTYVWSGAGGFSSSLQNPSYNYPGVGSYPWQVIISDGFATDTIRDTIVVGGAPDYQSILGNGHIVLPCFGTVYDTLDGGNFASYLWNTGAITPLLPVSQAGTYGVTVTHANGCVYYDSTVVQSVPADIAGHVSTSAGGILQNQKIYLIQYDTLLQALFAIDSIHTDSNGHYYFCNVQDTIVLIKAAPTQADYPTQMPTYADTSLTWANALQFFPLVQSPLVHDFATLFGANPGGPGFIGGLITQGANKANAIGDPVAGLRVFLIDRTTGDLLAYRDSDVNGYFAFPNIPLGDYAIVPDRYGVSVTNVPHIALTAQAAVQDSLDFELHSTWLELVQQTTGVNAALHNIAVQVAPNPFAQSTRLEIELPLPMIVNAELYNALGQVQRHFQSGELQAGKYAYTVGADLPSGIYFLKLSMGSEERTLKLIKE
jgi:PKD repeat protein